jgi:peptidyl-prolyl cis-trans isomerase SurA
MRRTLVSAALALLAVAPMARAQDSTASAAATSLAAVKWREPYVLDQVVGIVGDRAILWSDVLIAIGARLRGQPVPADPGDQLKLAQEALTQLADEEVLVQRARRDTAIKVTDAEANTQVDNTLKRIRDQFKSDAEFRDALRREGLGTVEDYKKKLLDDSKRQLLQQQLLSKAKRDGKLLAGTVSEQEVTEAFDKNRATLPKRPATVAFHQIVIAPTASDSAKRVTYARLDSIGRELLKDPSRFESVAKSVSQDVGSKEQGGDLGWNRRGQMVPSFDRMMFSLPPNTLSPIVETPFGFHIIRVDRVLPAEVKARHILLRPTIDSLDVKRARKLADSVVTVWRKGADYDSLSFKFHDLREERGSATPFVTDSLPPAYQKALTGAKKGDVVGPFDILDARTSLPKFVLAQVLSTTEPGEYTREEFKERIRDQLSDEKAIRRLLDGYRKETFVSAKLESLPSPLAK